MKMLGYLCLFAVTVYFSALTFFAAHETVWRELLAGGTGLAVLILLPLSFVRGLAAFPRLKFHAFIPMLICLIGLPVGFVGAVILGDSINRAHFQKNLPRFTKIVRLIESGEVKPDSGGRVQLPEEFSDLANYAFTHTYHDVRMVIFSTDEAFPVWSAGYVYISKETTDETDINKFVKNRNFHRRVTTNWFYVSD